MDGCILVETEMVDSPAIFFHIEVVLFARSEVSRGSLTLISPTLSHLGEPQPETIRYRHRTVGLGMLTDVSLPNEDGEKTRGGESE